MEHLLLKATVTATDQGTFSAVISTAAAEPMTARLRLASALFSV